MRGGGGGGECGHNIALCGSKIGIESYHNNYGFGLLFTVLIHIRVIIKLWLWIAT